MKGRKHTLIIISVTIGVVLSSNACLFDDSLDSDDGSVELACRALKVTISSVLPTSSYCTCRDETVKLEEKDEIQKICSDAFVSGAGGSSIATSDFRYITPFFGKSCSQIDVEDCEG